MRNHVIRISLGFSIVFFCLVSFIVGEKRGERSVGAEMNALAALEQTVIDFHKTHARLPSVSEMDAMRTKHAGSLIPCDLNAEKMAFYSGIVTGGDVVVVRVHTNGAFVITRERLD